jgi:hypothetical protein
MFGVSGSFRTYSCLRQRPGRGCQGGLQTAHEGNAAVDKKFKGMGCFESDDGAPEHERNSTEICHDAITAI